MLTSMNTTYNTILAHLGTEKYLPLRDAVRAGQLAWAKRALAFWIEEISELDPAKYHSFGNRFPRNPAGRFVPMPESVNKAPHYNLREAQVAAAKAGEYVLNEEAVLKDADAQWEGTKEFYAARVSEKINALLGETDAIAFSALSTNGGILAGNLTAALKDGKTLTLNTSLKTNFRYGENSANGDLTIYRQVPTLIVSSTGFDAKAKEAELEHQEKVAKLDKKALVKTLSEKIHILEKRKRPADDLASLLGYIAKFSGGVATGSHPECLNGYVAKLGLAEIPTLAAAKLIVKEIREAIKTAKADLKLARHA